MKYLPKMYAEALAELDSQGKLSPDRIRRFLGIVRRHGAIARLPEIVRRFEELVYRRLGITQLEVITAREIPRDFLRRVRSPFGPKTEIRARSAPDIIGGVILKVNDEVLIDASVRRRIQKLFLPR